MIIDAANIKEVFVYNPRPRLDDNERWYQVPRDHRYAFSTSGNLVFSENGRNWKTIERSYHCDIVEKNEEEYISKYGDAYCVKWAGEDNESLVFISELINMVFFPDIKAYKILPQVSYPTNRKWNYEEGADNKWSYYVTRCHVLFSQAEFIEYIRSKQAGEQPKYPQDQFIHHFINRDENITQKKLIRDWHNVLQRTTNEERKEARPDNRDSIICEEWLDLHNFAKWYFENRYPYSGEYGKLEIDKDILNFGRTTEYSPEFCCFLPSKINKLIGRKCSNKKERAKKLRKFISDEQPRYEVPETILKTLTKWAEIDEHGGIEWQ